MSREALLGALVMSLLITSTFIGFVNLAANDQFPADLFGSSASAPDGSLTYGSNSQQGIVIITQQNYSVSNGIDPNTTKIISGHWVQDDIGYYTTTTEENIIALNNIQPAGSVYTVKYIVNNTLGNSYFLYPRLINIVGLLGQEGIHIDQSIRVLFDSNGVHVLKWVSIIPGWSTPEDYFFLSLPNAQSTLTGGSEIVVTLDNNKNTYVGYNSLLTVNKDGVELFSTLVRDQYPNYYAFYGGFGSDNAGFYMQKVIANFFRNSQNDPIAYSNVLDALIGEALNFLSSVTQFIGSLAAFLGYSISSSLCPYWLSGLILLPQIAVIGYIIAELLRGT